MTNAEYVEKYPERFKDELDKWLFREFSILGGCCSSIEELKYNVARSVAEKATDYAIKQIDTNRIAEVKITNTSIISIPSGFDVKVGDKVLIIKEE